jgi:hypothetical protein
VQGEVTEADVAQEVEAARQLALDVVTDGLGAAAQLQFEEVVARLFDGEGGGGVVPDVEEADGTGQGSEAGAVAPGAGVVIDVLGLLGVLGLAATAACLGRRDLDDTCAFAGRAATLFGVEGEEAGVELALGETADGAGAVGGEDALFTGGGAQDDLPLAPGERAAELFGIQVPWLGRGRR